MKTWLLVLAAGLLSGCYGLRESMIVSDLPEPYRSHTSGFVLSPSKADIDAALALGKSDKDGQLVEYAYIEKPGGLNTYVMVHTPLFLMADHARDQAQEYRDPDQGFIDYCKGLDAIQISLQLQGMTQNYNMYAQRPQVILLRDGKRVEPLSAIKGYKGRDPFLKPDKKTQAAIDSMMRNASASMTPEAKAAMDSYYKILGAGAPAASGEISLSEFAGVFSAAELKKPGTYEVVFRTAQAINAFDFGGDKEKRYPISFGKFR